VTRSLTAARIAVVGATGGLGAPIALALTGRGAHVTALVRSPDSFGGRAFPCDLRDPASIRDALVAAGPLDGIVNAAGVVAFGAITDLDDATLDALFAVNALGPLRLMRAAASGAVVDGGFIVNVSAVVAESPVANMAAYSASKAALTAADTAIARELRRRKVHVLDARPPHTETGLATRPIAGQAPQLPVGLDPAVVAERIVVAIEQEERDLPSSAFTS
jgi:short-subunit dehydrogenase